MASAVALSSFFKLNCHLVAQTLHLSVELILRMWNLAFLNRSVFIWVSAKRRIGGSTCWSSPTLMVTSVTSFRLSCSATCLADERIASANAHSCIKSHNTTAQIKHIAKCLISFVTCSFTLYWLWVATWFCPCLQLSQNLAPRNSMSLLGALMQKLWSETESSTFSFFTQAVPLGCNSFSRYGLSRQRALELVFFLVAIQDLFLENSLNS